jgi:RNA polymerase sigma-70 factor (ECF subfamily)
MMTPLSTARPRATPALPPPWLDVDTWRLPRSPVRQARQPVCPHDASVLSHGESMPSLDDSARPHDESPRRPDGTARLRDHLSDSYAALHGRLVRRFRCADLAHECLHEAWLRLQRPVLAEVREADAYVFRMACHLAIDRLRGQASWLSLDDPAAALPELVDETPGPQAVSEGRSALAALSRILDQLPRRQRAVLIALRVEGRSRADAAAWLGMSMRSVDTALRQALRHCEQAAALI